FFFSSRRRHTRCYRDWSSDVCSSDLWRSMENKQSTLKAFTIILSLLVLAGPLLPFGDAQAVEKQKGPEEKAVPASTITGIQLSFKLDPRLTDSTYGGELWVSAPTHV